MAILVEHAWVFNATELTLRVRVHATSCCICGVPNLSFASLPAWLWSLSISQRSGKGDIVGIWMEKMAHFLPSRFLYCLPFLICELEMGNSSHNHIYASSYSILMFYTSLPGLLSLSLVHKLLCPTVPLGIFLKTTTSTGQILFFKSANSHGQWIS